MLHIQCSIWEYKYKNLYNFYLPYVFKIKIIDIDHAAKIIITKMTKIIRFYDKNF